MWKSIRKLLERFDNLILRFGSLEIFARRAIRAADALDAEAQRGRRRDSLPPHHVTRLGDTFQFVLLVGGRLLIDLAHFLVHILHKNARSSESVLDFKH